MKSSKTPLLMIPLAAGAAGMLSQGCKQNTKDGPKPNVLIIYTDDMGIGDISSYGQEYSQTPNIDRIGKDGIVFSSYYTACPISSPSRVGVTTGMYPTQWGVTTFLNDRRANRNNKSNDYLLSCAPTMAKAFKQSGYATGHFGKWHMGGGRDVKDMPGIPEYGFDEYSSTWESPDPDPLITGGDWIWCDQDSIKRWDRTAYFVDKTLDFLKRHKGEPCFVNLWPDDMHTPYVPSKEAYEQGIAKGQAIWDEEINFVPVLEEYDRQIGRLLDGIEELGLADNTIIIFTSDNGPAPSYGNARTVGLRGQKATLYEGGIKMPFLIRWPARIKAGQTNSKTVITSIDLYPTLCAMAGIPTNSGDYTLDGLDMSKCILGKMDQKRNSPMYWEFGQHFVGKPQPKNSYQFRSPNIAVRDGDWKMIVNYDGSQPELFNLAKDPTETRNLVSAEPEIAQKMSKMATDWFKEYFRKEAGELVPVE